MSPRVAGIDLSLASTGLADNRGRVDRVQTKSSGADATVSDVLRRLHRIVAEVQAFATLGADLDGTKFPADPADLVVIEGPAYGTRRQGGEHVRAGCWWLVADRLTDWGLPILVVPPSVRAMYATGKGNASKDAVLAAAIKRYPAWDITGNDVADAVVLAAIGARLLGHPIDDLPKTHLRALDKLRLPATLTATKED